MGVSGLSDDQRLEECSTFGLSSVAWDIRVSVTCGFVLYFVSRTWTFLLIRLEVRMRFDYEE